MCLKISLGWEVYIFCVLKMIAVISKLLFIFLLHTHTQKYTNSAFSSRMVFSLPQSFFRSSHQRCSVRKVFLEISQNSQENTCAPARPATLLKKRLSHRCFHVNFVKFLSTPFSQNTSWQLLLFLQEFIFNQTYTAWISFWFLEKQGSTNDSIHRLLLLSRKSLDRIDKIAFKTFVSSSVHVIRKDIFHSAPYTKLLLVHTSQ